jgi:hypothetical protein
MGSLVIENTQYAVFGFRVPHPIRLTVTHPGDVLEVCVYVAEQRALVASVVGDAAGTMPMSVLLPLVTVPGAKHIVPEATV